MAVKYIPVVVNPQGHISNIKTSQGTDKDGLKKRLFGFHRSRVRDVVHQTSNQVID